MRLSLNDIGVEDYDYLDVNEWPPITTLDQAMERMQRMQHCINTLATENRRASILLGAAGEILGELDVPNVVADVFHDAAAEVEHGPTEVQLRIALAYTDALQDFKANYSL